jgi:hypothetical protein
MRSMVEGAILLAQHCWESPLHHAASRRGPPPRAGEDNVRLPPLSVHLKYPHP